MLGILAVLGGRVRGFGMNGRKLEVFVNAIWPQMNADKRG
jgi:hypothetical protein